MAKRPPRPAAAKTPLPAAGAVSKGKKTKVVSADPAGAAAWRRRGASPDRGVRRAAAMHTARAHTRPPAAGAAAAAQHQQQQQQ